ncbi:MAG TPA: response regulator [Cyanobacteria bacterium UBA11049]|nr:response regulator [Cyanobacteria bacterium UBA11049]
MTKVLVIEDDGLTRDIILNLLFLTGISAIAAADGRAGLQLATKIIPDLILCDVRMPELSGYDVLAALRQDSTTATIPFIFLTAETNQDAIERGQQLGANGYLNKPFTTAELLSAIAPYLSKAREEEKN